MKLATTFLMTAGFLGTLANPALGQAPSSATPGKNVSRTTKAVNYRRAGAAKIDFQGTELMQQASGEARVQNKGNRTEIEARFTGLDEATKLASNISPTFSGPSLPAVAPSTSAKWCSRMAAGK